MRMDHLRGDAEADWARVRKILAAVLLMTYM